MKIAKYSLSGVRPGTVMLKPRGIIEKSYPIRKETNSSLSRDVNITSGCTKDEHGTEYSNAR
jgi:hypothetical protein